MAQLVRAIRELPDRHPLLDMGVRYVILAAIVLLPFAYYVVRN